MADKATKTAKTTPGVAESGGFQFDTGLALPPMTRSSGTSETAAKLAAMPVGASFLEPVAVPDTIKDPEEREKVFKEQARTASNRLSGAIRRFKKNHPEGYEFAMRTVDSPELGTGVRVWREEAAS